MQTYADQLRQVRDSLSEENWRQCSYFSGNSQSKRFCMCVHGAAQLVINPKIKQLQIDANDVNDDSKLFDIIVGQAVGLVPMEVSTAAILGSNRSKLNSRKEAWIDRPAWVKDGRDLHFLMGMFGLTTRFNDDPSTTLKEIKYKLDEAIQWAEANAEFLQTN